MKIYKNIKEYKFILLIITIFFLLFFIVENINHRFWLNDFKVYYNAANSFLHGENIYNRLFSLGSGYYKYSPFALIFFIPFTLLPFSLAKVVFFFLYYILFSIFMLFLYKNIIKKFIFPEVKNINKIIGYTFLVIVIHIYREAHLGNINLILLFLITIALYLLLEDKNILSGIISGIVILFKPFFILILPLYFIRKKIKTLIVSILTIIGGIFLPAIFIGLKHNNMLLKEWIHTMLYHNIGATQSQKVHTIQNILSHFCKYFINTNSTIYNLSIIILAGTIIFFIIIQNLKKENSLKERALIQINFIIEFFIILAIIPNILITDTEHFLLSTPLIMSIISFLSLKKEKNLIFYFSILAFIMYGGNWHDLWGKYLSGLLNQYGILGIGNITIILITIIILPKIQKKIVENNK